MELTKAEIWWDLYREAFSRILSGDVVTGDDHKPIPELRAPAVARKIADDFTAVAVERLIQLAEERK